MEETMTEPDVGPIPQTDTHDEGGGGDTVPGFLDNLPEDLRNHEALSGVENLEQLTKAYLDVRGQVDGLPKPPETPDEYSLTGLPIQGLGWDVDMEQSFRSAAREAGLTQDQFRAVLDWGVGQSRAQVDALARTKANAANTLRSAWGQHYERNLEKARRTGARLFGDAFAEVADGTGLGNNARAIMALYEASRHFDEDPFHKGGPARSAEKSIAETLYPNMGSRQ
jgi:hypothetical protein